jgi:hypothetical protein
MLLIFECIILFENNIYIYINQWKMFKSNEKMFHYVELIRTILTFQYVTQATFSYLPTRNVIFLMFSLVPNPFLCLSSNLPAPETAVWPGLFDCVLSKNL